MSSMTPNSLPGFLRRTIRSVHYDDHEDEEEEEGGGEDPGKLQALDDSILNPVSIPVGSPHRSSLIPTTINNSPSLLDDEAGSQEQQQIEQDNDNNHKDCQGEISRDIMDLNLQNPEDAVDCKFRLVAKNDVKLMSNVVTREDIDNNGVVVLLDRDDGQEDNTTLLNMIPNQTCLAMDSSDLKSKSPRNNNVAVVASDAAAAGGGGGGVTSSSTATTTTATQTFQKKNYKEEQFEKVITSLVVDIEHLKKLAWNGIPSQHRPLAWKILLGYLPTNSSRRSQTLKRKRSEYKDAILQHYDIEDHSRTMQEQETLRQVLVDVPRTAPDVPLFRNDSIRQSLARLLYIWAMRHPASSYVQGINDLATPLIAVFLSEYLNGDVLQGQELEDLTPDILHNVEADVYWCLTNLLAGIQDHYTQDQPGVQRMVMKLEELVKRIDVSLTRHLEETGVQFIQFAFRWMNCLLLREFHLRSVIRLWDTYLSEGNGGFETFHVYVCAAFLCQFSADLQNMQFDELFAFMQNIPTGDWDDGKIEIVLSQAFVLSTLFQGSDAHLTSSNPNPKQL